MTKKNLIVLIISIIVILLLALLLCSYKFSGQVENTAGGAQTENQDFEQNSELEDAAKIEEVQINGNSNIGGLSICFDQCGNSICQTADPNCDENSQLNCICPETPQNCPQDCQE